MLGAFVGFYLILNSRVILKYILEFYRSLLKTDGVFLKNRLSSITKEDIYNITVKYKNEKEEIKNRLKKYTYWGNQEKELKEKLTESEISEIIAALRRATIPADVSGGGPLWGINGVVCVGHGRSKAPEVASTIGTAKRVVEIDLVGTFRTELAAIKGSMDLQYSNE